MSEVNRPPIVALALALALALAGCARIASPYDDLPELGVATQLRLENLCSGGKSPAIAIAKPAAGTARYRIKLTNMSVLWQTPREWTIPVPAEPAMIPVGALRDYSGPCPGEFQRFNFRLETLALGESGTELAYGSIVMPVESVNRMARETWKRGGTPRPSGDDDGMGRDADFRDPFPIGRDRAYDPYYDRRQIETLPRGAGRSP